MAKVNISKLARAAGLAPSVVHNRLAQGWTMDEALKIPKYGRRRKSAPVTPALTTEARPSVSTKVIEQPVPQKSSPSWMPIVVVGVVALLLVLALL